MHKLITMANPRLAQAFVDYMATHQIEIKLRVVEHEIELWLMDETKLPIAEKELTNFVLNPMDSRYSAASWQTGTTNTGIVYTSSNNILATIYHKAGKLTLSVMAICIVVFLIMQSQSGYIAMLSTLTFPINSQQYWQLWRWISPIFLHFSIFHILFNLVMWWYLAGRVEQNLGIGKLFEITLLSGLVSNCAQSFFSGNMFGGISGVVYALVGYCWLYGERRADQPIYLERSITLMAVAWMILGYMGVISNIANAAHLSGFLVGLALAGWNTLSLPGKS